MRNKTLVKIWVLHREVARNQFFPHFLAAETNAHKTFWVHLPSRRASWGHSQLGEKVDRPCHTIAVLARNHFRKADQIDIRGKFQCSDVFETLIHDSRRASTRRIALNLVKYMIRCVFARAERTTS